MASESNAEAIPIKIKKPVLKSVVARQQLFAALDGIYTNNPVIWLNAPAGFGKTTLAASYAEDSNCPVLWYRFDESDHDPSYFFENILAAAKVESVVLELPFSFKPEYLGGLEAFARQFFRSVFPNDGTRKLLVLDDFHVVENAPYMLKALLALFREIPESYRCLILSRNTPPTDIATPLYASLRVLSGDFLLFDKAEAVQLAKLMNYDYQTPEWGALLMHCQGWVAALVIKMREKAHHPIQGRRTLNSLANAALIGLEESIRQQLREMAVPRTISKTLAIELTGASDAAFNLSRLAEEFFLVSRTQTDFEAYTLHALLRGFLLYQQRLALGATGFNEFLAKNARLLELHGELDQAVDIYCQASLWDDVQRMIMVHAKQELAAGRSLRLLSWLNALPEMPGRNPWLYFWQAMATLPMDQKLAQALFQRAHHGFGDDPLGRAISAAGVVTAIFFAFDDFSNAIEWLDELAQLDGFVSSLGLPDIEAMLLGCGNLLLHFDCHPDLCQSWINRSQALLPNCPAQNRLILATFLLQHYIWSGEFDACHTLLIRLQHEMPEHDPFSQINLLVWRSIADFMTNRHAESYQALEQALQLAEDFGLSILYGQIYGHEVYTAQSCLDLTRASAVLAKMETTLTPEHRLDIAYFYHLRSGMGLLQNDLPQAKADAETALNICREIRIQSVAVISQQVLAQILVNMGDWPAAKTHLNEVEEYCTRTGKHYILFTAQLTRAYGLLTIAEHDSAAEVLKTALALAKQRQYRNVFPYWLPKVMSQLCAFALEQGIERDYVRRLIVWRGLNPPENTTEQWPWPIKLRTLGSFRVDVRAGNHLIFGKQDAKPLQLLQWLVILNPDGVSRHKLADLLWPDADADAALHALEVNLQRLRKAIGLPEALVLKGNRLSLNRQYCWLDAWVLDDVVRQVDKANSDVMTQAERLLQVWRGPFMADIDHPLAQAKREMLKGQFTRTIEKLGLRL